MQALHFKADPEKELASKFWRQTVDKTVTFLQQTDSRNFVGGHPGRDGALLQELQGSRPTVSVLWHVREFLPS